MAAPCAEISLAANRSLSLKGLQRSNPNRR
jgi:hypothetical protein